MRKRSGTSKPKESLVEWVMRAEPAERKIASRNVEQVGGARAEAAKAAASGPKYITLPEWATLMFGNAAPHQNTLLRWVREGRIQPQPRKIGGRYWLTRGAEYIGDD